MSSNRIFNFSAGPAVMPLAVLEEAQRDLVALPGVGMSVMEISHRSKTFENLLAQAIDDIRALAGLDAGYKVLMLQGGASLQFSMAPMNLLGAGQTADEALKLVNNALEKLPDHPDILSSRGEILLAMEQWPQAVTDLRHALTIQQDNAELHRLLEQAYRGLPDPGMAEEHKHRAEALENASR